MLLCQYLMSQTLTVPSSEQEANLASVGLKLTLLIGSLWAWNILTLFMLLCQYLMYPPWSPVTIHTSLWLHCMALTGLSCACRMVSKLKVSPFHRVNSPLEAPVIRRRPSGVQDRQKMGHRILLVAVFTNLVVTALTELSRVSWGGTMSG